MQNAQHTRSDILIPVTSDSVTTLAGDLDNFVMGKMKEVIVDHIPGTDSTGMDDGSLSSSVSSGSGFETPDDDDDEPEIKPKADPMVEEENSAVFTVRSLVFLVLVISTVGTSLGVFFYLNRAQTSDFESNFEDDALKVFDAISEQIEKSLGAIDAYNLDLASYASSTNMNWPRVTIPDSAARMSRALIQAKASSLQQVHVVPQADMDGFLNYALANSEWVDETFNLQETDPSFEQVVLGTEAEAEVNGFVTWDGNELPTRESLRTRSQYVITWQSYPILPALPAFAVDLSGHPTLGRAIQWALEDEEVVLSEVTNLESNEDSSGPVSAFLVPVLSNKLDPATVDIPSDKVAVVKMTFDWSNFFGDILREGENGLVVVVENTCGQVFSYRIDGPLATYLGPEDLHERSYDDTEVQFEFSDFLSSSYRGVPLSEEFCGHTMKIYASAAMEDDYKTATPLLFTISTVCIFLFTSAVFVLYDLRVSRRQKKVLQKAQKSDAILSSLYPENVRERLFKEKKKGKGFGRLKDKLKKKKGGKDAIQPTKSRMKSFLKDGDGEGGGGGDAMDFGDGAAEFDRPIADLFPETTIMFADISGFTAWSSVREPSQVFTLLERIYGAFDRLATRRGVFKVETIGDSYVAVAGLPEPRQDHAVCMIKFADQCRSRFNEITRELEFNLGPETGDLKMRFGLNSGPTTAGVLRGQKSRFQLFGDSVNTAARMESTGLADYIQVSQSTADLIVSAKKGHWLVPREEKIDVKGKGMMQTYFVDPRNKDGLSVSLHSTSVESVMAEQAHKNERMVYWCTDTMAKSLKEVVQRRRARENSGAISMDVSAATGTTASLSSAGEVSRKQSKKHAMVIEEVVEIIHLPEFDAEQEGPIDPEFMLDTDVMRQLREYVTEISGTYRENPFHSFEHASHVVMSVSKLLSRIIAPDQVLDKKQSSHNDLALHLHDYTYGITSDPLTQFACIFAALIHDCDHYGIPNNQLVEERAPLAYRYKNRSPAEQNSVNIAWKILMKPHFATLRSAICPTEEEMKRFRQLVVNSVMATDIADKQMKTLRNGRWARAFSDEEYDESERDQINRKATIVIEHLIQASDVAHTMQHWHVYTKWNERLFQEMSLAFLVGRASKDPAEFWYKGELGFYDFYIIPLAKKLSECGVFGVSSDEYLNYAMRNREEWERRGEQMLEDMKRRFAEKVKREYGDLGVMSGISVESAESAVSEVKRS